MIAHSLDQNQLDRLNQISNLNFGLIFVVSIMEKSNLIKTEEEFRQQ